MNKEFSPEIQSKSTFKKGHNYRIVSSEDTSDETDKKSNSYECLSAELDESDSENESDVAVDPAEDSAELFRSPHKNTVRKQSEVRIHEIIVIACLFHFSYCEFLK